MANEEKDKDKDEELKPGEKQVDVDASATVSDEEGPTHEVDVQATAKVTDLREKQDEKEQEALGVNCVYCGRASSHWNANCPVAQAEASQGAAEPKAKAAAGATGAVGTRQQFQSSGRPD